MTQVTENYQVIDDYFGSLSLIKDNNTLIKKLATDFFERSVQIEMLSDSSSVERIEKKGFILIDDFRIPFRCIQEGKPSRLSSMDITLYHSVVYSRDKHFNHDDYHHINTAIKNVSREKVDDYIQKLITVLPEKYSIELTGVLKSLYFYPHIDNKNGKSMKMLFDVVRNTASYFINHNQSTSTIFNSNMSFFYDGEMLSLNSQHFTMIKTKTLDFEDYWKCFLSKHFSQSSIQDLMNHQYSNMNDVLFDLERALKVIEMNEI